MEKTTSHPKKRADRVLLLVTQADWGGVQWFLTQFASELKNQGRDVLLACGGEGELFDRAEKLGIRTYKLQHVKRNITPTNLIHDVLAIREIQHLIDTWKPDAVHLNSSKMGILGSLAATRSRTKPWTVYRIGGWVFLEPLPATIQWIYKIAERISARWKDIIITVHPGDAELAKNERIIPRQNIRAIANGIDATSFVAQLLSRGAAREALGLPEHAFVIGTVANAYPSKALLPYLDVLDRALKEDRNAYAVIVGDGPEFAALTEKHKTLDIKDRILLAGRRSDAQRLYAAFDLFVLPSRKEGMPWTLLEAMAASRPIIATDVGACRWMLTDDRLGNAGLVVPPNNAPALLDAIHALRTQPEERHALGQGGWRMTSERFSWKHTLQGNIDALDRN